MGGCKARNRGSIARKSRVASPQTKATSTNERASLDVRNAGDTCFACIAGAN
jgi:hypothetical protein